MLETIWFSLWAILWAAYFVTDGFDLGLGMASPFLARGEADRKTIYNAMGPFWDGNEVWLVTAGGVTFAAFPATYAVLFSSLYSPLMIILFGLIVRAVSMEFRGKFQDRRWRKVWDGGLVAGSFVPALLFGVAFANLFRGIPIDGNGVYQGNLFSLLNLYGLAGGLLFVLLLLLHGTLWLTVKSDGLLRERAARFARRMWVPALAMTVVFLIETTMETNLFDNYLAVPALFLILAVTVAAFIAVRLGISRNAWRFSWTCSAVVVAGVVLFGVAGLYPNLVLSSIERSYSLTAFNSSSSPLSLTIMLVVALIFVPIVIVYQGWVHKIFKGKLEETESEY